MKFILLSKYHIFRSLVPIHRSKLTYFLLLPITVISFSNARAQSANTNPVMIKSYLQHLHSQLKMQREVYDLNSQKNIDFYLKALAEQALKNSQRNRCLASEHAFNFYTQNQQKMLIKTSEIISYNIAMCYQKQNNSSKARQYLHTYLQLVTRESDPENVKTGLLSYINLLNQSDISHGLESEFYFLHNLNVPENVESYKYFGAVQLFYRLGNLEKGMKHVETMVQAKKLDGDP